MASLAYGISPCTRFMRFAELCYEYRGDLLQDMQRTVRLPDELRGAVLRRQMDYLAGRTCALHALQAVGVTAAIDIPIGSDGAPEWPDGYVGSITHCDGRAIAVAADSTQIPAIGIDLEKRLSSTEAQEIAGQVLDEKELALREHHDLSFEAWMSIAFSAKESLFKALYRQVGYRFDFHDVAIHRVDTANGLLDMRLRKTLSKQCGRGAKYSVRFLWRDAGVMTLCLPA